MDGREQLLQDSMKKKELKPVDHSKISYIDVRKNLYIIPKALANAPEDQVGTPFLQCVFYVLFCFCLVCPFLG